MIVFQSINSSMELISTWNKTKQSNIRFSISSTYSGDLATNSKYDYKDMMAKMTNIILWYKIAMEWSQGKKNKELTKESQAGWGSSHHVEEVRRQGGGGCSGWGRGCFTRPASSLEQNTRHWETAQTYTSSMEVCWVRASSRGSEEPGQGSSTPSGGGWCQERLLVLNPKQWP